MRKIVNFGKKFLKDDRGVSAIEYGLLATLIAVAIIAGATLLGTELNAKFDSIAKTVKSPT